VNGLMIREDGSVLLNRNLPFEPVVDREHRARVQYDLETLLETRPADLTKSGDWKEFVRRAREWAQFGLLTTETRRSQYRDLGTLMRQGTPAADAVKDAFGVPLAQIAAEFEDGRWRREAQFRMSTPGGPIALPPATKLAPSADTLLQVVASRVSQQRPKSM
jgi:hypothetical protein